MLLVFSVCVLYESHPAGAIQGKVFCLWLIQLQRHQQWIWGMRMCSPYGGGWRDDSARVKLERPHVVAVTQMVRDLQGVR